MREARFFRGMRGQKGAATGYNPFVSKVIGPQKFGRYVLRRSLAKGGMAEIYLADWAAAGGIKKQVVVKKILPTFADDDHFVSMFIDEAAISVKLSHGNIAQVFDFGEINGEYFITMEYIRGQSLSEIIRRAAAKNIIIPPHIACYIVMEMCKGLHYAHQRADERGQPLGIVHRDISPQNVMISYEGQVKLVDFGIAKARNVASKTRAGALKGKYIYFSPEQARGKPLDARSDVFAAGIVLYELITDKLPFSGQVIDVLQNIVSGRFPLPSESVPTIQPSLERIVLKAMNTGLEGRYQSALELQQALAGHLFKVAPRFTSASLTHFLRFLYRDELVQQGLSVDIPSDLLEQIPLWERDHGQTLETAPDPATEETDPELGSKVESTRWETEALEEERGSTSGNKRRGLDLVRRKRRLQAIAAALITLGTLVVIGVAATSVMRALAPPAQGVGLLIIDSNPSGAEVTIDGKKTEDTTPIVLDGLSPERTYFLSFSLDGYRDAWDVVTISPEGPTTLSVSLEEIPPTPTAPSLAEIEETIRRERGERPPREPERREPARKRGLDQLSDVGSTIAQLIEQAEGSLDPLPATPVAANIQPSRLTLDIERLPSLRVSLDATSRHTLRVRGEVVSSDHSFAAPSSKACYLVVRENGIDVGVISRDSPVHVERGAQLIHLLIPTLNPSETTGELAVFIQTEEGRLFEETLDAKANAFNPAQHGAAIIDGLSAAGRYRVSLSDTELEPPLLFLGAPPTSSFTRRRAVRPTMGVFSQGRIIANTERLAVFSLSPAPLASSDSLRAELTPE